MALGVSLAAPSAHRLGSWHLQRSLSSGYPSQARLSVHSARLAARCSSNDLSDTSIPSLQVAWHQDLKSLVHQNVTGVVSFLKEQVREFQKIEWPSLESTVKTSLFVIVLSFLLIVALTMVDSCYSFMLAKILRSA